MRKATKEWLKAALDDLLVIKQIINIEHLTHMVAFHAQQSIEKILKSLLEENEIEIPKIHKLINLRTLLSDKITIENEDMLKQLDELYIDSRYPGDLGLLPYGKPSLEEAKEFYKFALDIFDKVCDILEIDKNGLLQ